MYYITVSGHTAGNCTITVGDGTNSESIAVTVIEQLDHAD